MNSLMNQARVLVRHCLEVEAGEIILIIWDGTVSADLKESCRYAIQELKADSFLLVHEPIWRRPLKEYCFFAGSSQRNDVSLPKIMSSSLNEADASIILNSDMDLLFAPEWEPLLKREKRFLFLPYLSTDGAQRMLPETKEEVEQLYDLVNKYGALLREGNFATLQSPQGTNLKMELGQWDTKYHSGKCGKGMRQVLPAGQITRVPNNGTAAGTLVIDRSIADNDYRTLHEPIYLEIDRGDVIKISGGSEARRLETFLASLRDPSVYHVTELGIGTNHRCRQTGIGAPTEDTHTWGTVSMAIGCDTHIGGGTPGPAHIDMTMWFPTLTIDGKIVSKEGKLVAQ
jgi:leucyl aminopeptidase (aminopeptidase T)